MPVEFLTKEQRSKYKSFPNNLTIEEIAKHFLLDNQEKNIIYRLIGGKLKANGFKYLVDNVPIDTIKLYLDNWSKFTPGKNPVGFFINACVEKYDIPKMIHNKPIQSMNYEQREYDDEFFDSLYVDLDKVQRLKKPRKAFFIFICIFIKSIQVLGFLIMEFWRAKFSACYYTKLNIC